MFSTKEFDALQSVAKKQYLLTIFWQLPDKTVEQQDIVDLLSSEFPFQATTLQTIYNAILEAIDTGKEKSQTSMQHIMHDIHDKLEQEAEISWLEADDMLDGIV
jgi:gas vesicle protein